MQKPIAIIGGGPGGLSAAIRAAELGLRVILYEKRQIGCGIKCAEGFIDTLGVLEKSESGVLFKVEKVNSFTPSASVARLIWRNILLVGDAAALCSPLHGGGIDVACINGRLAAELIASNQISQYPTRLWDIICKKLAMEKRVRSLWHFFGNPFIRGILRYPGLLSRIIFNKRPIPQILGFGSKRVF